MIVYHQQGVQLDVSNESIEFFFGKNNNDHQIGIGYLDFDENWWKNSGNFKNVDADGKVDESIGLVNIAFAHDSV